MAGLTKNDIEAMRIDRRYRAIWWLAAFAALSFCFRSACDAYVKLNDDPPVVKIVVTIVSAVLYLVGPCSLFYIVERRHRAFIRDFASRLAKIEQAVDPGRSTSGLHEDGSDPAPGTAT